MDLPVKASETAALAELIFTHAEGKSLNDELRNRLAGRAGLLQLSSFKPYFGSLARDPAHPSTYYLAVDGRNSQPLLLHIALATAPTSGIFPNPLLIGRMRAAGREIVVNSIPFASKDWENVSRYAEQVDSAFLPRPQGARPAIAVGNRHPEISLPITTLLLPTLKPQDSSSLASLRSLSPPASIRLCVIKLDQLLAHSKERPMHEEKITADRLTAFSDAVFAVIVTVMVLELKAPDEPAFSALWPLWPTAISYAVSYLFIVIIWINHHHLMRFVGSPTLGLIWMNFVHLFMVSLLPFATAWIARTKLASSPVVLYAALFVCVDIAYNVFEHQVLARADATTVSAHVRHMARRRSLIVLAGFTTAMLVALVAPRLGFGLICGALVLHLRPDVSVSGS
jgi:uncharacterized membrane protein